MKAKDFDIFIDAIWGIQIENWTKIDDLIYNIKLDNPEQLPVDYIHELEENILKSIGEEETEGPLLKRLQNKISTDSNNLFELKIEIPDVFIKSTSKGLHFNSKSTESYFNKLEDIRLSEESSTKNHGHFYEKFISFYLNDLGLYNKITAGSGDYGVDIIGRNKTVISSTQIPSIEAINIWNYLFIQCKMYGSKVGIPDLRKLLGDIMFFRSENHPIYGGHTYLKHKPVIPVFVSHFGYKNGSNKFAEEQGIVLWESRQIISNLIVLKHHKKVTSLKLLDEKHNETK